MTSNQPWWLTMPPEELAATILPLFSSHAPEPEQRVIKAVAQWCRTGSYRLPGTWGGGGKKEFNDPDFRAAAEAVPVLEHARLVMRAGADRLDVGLTRLGWHALQTNTVRQHLGLAPPTA